MLDILPLRGVTRCYGMKLLKPWEINGEKRYLWPFERGKGQERVASTVFNIHVSKFVGAIWFALKDQTLAVREREL